MVDEKYNISVEMNDVENKKNANTFNKIRDSPSPDHIRTNGKVNGLDSSETTPTHTSVDLILSNPSLVEEKAAFTGNCVTLSWNDLRVDANLPPPSCFKRLKKKKTTSPQKIPILKKVTGNAVPGSLLAIMGASGAGKTTFLNVLSYQNMAGLDVTGDVTINGRNIKSKIKNISAYVQQEDLFIGTLTVREHLTFQALLRMGNSYTTKQKKARIDEVMRKLGLLKCKDTIIGVPGRIKGISGGENKRLSFASEIITNPQLLFVDEPTSGLDSFMAENVIKALQEIAKEGKTILATIHQPSSAVFQLFDRLLLMSEGRTAYLGTTKDAIQFFSDVGYPSPLNFNPADHYVHTLAIIPSQVEECKQKTKAICDYYDSQYSVKGKTDANVIVDVLSTSKQKYKVGYLKQMRAVFVRSWKSNSREPYISKLRIVQAVVIALIAGLVYLDQDNTSSGAENLNGAIFFCITTLSFNTITGSLFVFPAEFPVFLKEHKLAMYRTDVYFFSKIIAELPWYIVSTLIFGTIVYWMTGLKSTAEAFFIFIGILQLICQCALSFSYFVSAISPTVQVATSIGAPLMMPFLLFGGFFIKDESVPSYFIWLKWLSWFKYANECLQINQWDGFGIIECDRPKNNTCIANGQDVLLRNKYDMGNFNRNIGLMFALAIGFRLIAYVIVEIRARRAK